MWTSEGLRARAHRHTRLVRVTIHQVEHANGVIKARWGSLKRMPIDIRSDEDVPRCSNWITSCVVLHNLLIFLRDEFEYADVPQADDDGNDDVIAAQPSPPAKEFQNAVRDRWLVDVLGWE